MFADKRELRGKSAVDTLKIQSGRKVIREIQRTFGYMTIGNKSYVKPVELLNVIVDDKGE